MLTAKTDPNHRLAVRRLQLILDGGEALLTHMDHISFLVMKRCDVPTAFAFDPDFGSAGFQLFEE